MTTLLACLASHYHLPEGACLACIEAFREKTLSKKEFLLRSGQICRNLYFVEEGLLYTYYCKGEKEISACFIREGEFSTSLESFFNQEPAIENIRAVERSMIRYVSYDALQSLYQEFPALNCIGRQVLEKFAVAQYRRFQGMWMQSAKDRYTWVLEQHPWLFKELPGKYLASYLGITEGMLSRLKAKR